MLKFIDISLSKKVISPNWDFSSYFLKHLYWLFTRRNLVFLSVFVSQIKFDRGFFIVLFSFCTLFLYIYQMGVKYHCFWFHSVTPTKDKKGLILPFHLIFWIILVFYFTLWRISQEVFFFHEFSFPYLLDLSLFTLYPPNPKNKHYNWIFTCSSTYCFSLSMFSLCFFSLSYYLKVSLNSSYYCLFSLLFSLSIVSFL